MIKKNIRKIKNKVRRLKKKVKIRIIEYSNKNKFLRIYLKTAKNFIDRLKYIRYMLINRVENKIILFDSFNGRNYNCSPKAIYEKMLTMEEFSDYKFVWVFRNKTKHDVKKDERLVIVKHNSKDYYKYYASAKYWIVNSLVSESIIKKKKQVYIQCWHGTPLKKLRYDIEVEGVARDTIKENRKRNDIDAKRFDYFISPSKYCTEKFTSAFNLVNLKKEHILIEEGYPRNDSLFNMTKKEVQEIKNKLKIPENKKVMFYMPTFRDNQHKSGVGYTYDLEIDIDSLQRKFGNDYILLFRPHYFIANKINFKKYGDFVVNVANYDDVNDLYLICDIIITDYSSVFFDFANLKKPMIFYMYDLDEYQNHLRDFYISLDELPGKITQTQEDLERAILSVEKDFIENQKKYREFNDKYNYLDDGNASERVIRTIFNKQKEEN